MLRDKKEHSKLLHRSYRPQVCKSALDSHHATKSGNRFQRTKNINVFQLQDFSQNNLKIYVYIKRYYRVDLDKSLDQATALACMSSISCKSAINHERINSTASLFITPAIAIVKQCEAMPHKTCHPKWSNYLITGNVRLHESQKFLCKSIEKTCRYLFNNIGICH